MIQEFEKWMKNQSFSTEVCSLFGESIRCFSFSAYRASLIFSYLAFNTVVKERFLKANLPNGFPQQKWDKLINDVNNEDLWDSTVFDIVQTLNPVPIFNISESLRQQIRYWKDRRNDCAHFKNNEISYFHVESFWAFIKSNLTKIKIKGSRRDMIEKIERHFDNSLTPPNTSVDYILTEIPHAVIDNEFLSFLEEVHEFFESKTLIRIGYTIEELDFYEELFKVDSEMIREKFKEYINTRELILEKYIKRFPSRLYQLSLSKEFERKLWYKYLFNMNSDSNTDAEIFCSILLNESTEDIKHEMFKHLLDKGMDFIPSEEQKRTMESSGFFEFFHRYVYQEKKICSLDFVNNNLVVYHMQNYSMDSYVVSSLCEAFERTVYNIILFNSIKDIFKDNEVKRQAFLRIAEENRFTNVPISLVDSSVE